MLALDFRHLLTPELKRGRERTRWHVRRSAQGGLPGEEYLASTYARRVQAAELRSRGLPWEAVGSLMGLTGNAARKLAERLDSQKSG